MQSRSSRLLLLVEPEPWLDGRSQLRVEHEALAHHRGELADVTLRLIDMLDHQFAHPVRIAAARGCQQMPVGCHIGVAELLCGGMVRMIAHRDTETQQGVDYLAHEAQQLVGIGARENVVEMQVLLALGQGLSLVGGLRCTARDALLQRSKMLLRQVWHGASGKLGLEQAAHGIDLADIEGAEKEIVLYELEGALERHLADGGTPSGSRGYGDQPVDFQRLQCLPSRALADTE